MSTAPTLPTAIVQALRPVLRLMGPVLDVPATAEGRAGSPVVVCRASPDVVRRRVAASCAVYVAWDNRGGCRYVGSVCRQGPCAVGDRLAEHYAHRTVGVSRRTSWCLLTVLPLSEGTPLEAVRVAEGWTARLLNPADGSAHPRVDLTQTPATLVSLPAQVR
ncbi:hypothetical protein [Streptomyces sp. AM8-1-1]|uniref:hypothetical protein n=1 Tax=Streptomyces sp. AM8-1-1 TaxID=3075825 RepID=UPI0028C43155|nr:hypothetical protein [Streptomyces sp. AM8-1-1]WNO70120.1 hypothetical protein RPQ07_00025 [Streptomyces sp. AM8-1-1]WNO76995.1 hypothetical protein RPQ07_37700 [Streptomyces sp. AM8-1-1]